MENQKNNQREERVEELAEALSLKLADKLERHEISLEKMGETIQAFVYYANIGKELEELEKFVNNA